ncbi:MAG: response regulator transcription factor [Thermaerobacter sp.]|nr:response regulator transcription factor [Thermaerobacter sp.]
MKGAVVQIARILVCDDDREIVEAIKIYLRHENHEVICVYNGHEALQSLLEKGIELVILDIMMPGLDGIRALVKLREAHNLPVIFLSAKSEDSDKVLGLNLGADDYITKPFSPLELLARVRAQLRRYTTLGSQACSLSCWQSGGLFVDDERKEVTMDGAVVRLTPAEYRILKFLLENAGRVFSIDQIYRAAWSETAYNPANTVAVHIRRIREKIEINPKEPKYLKVVWGIGYKVEKY